MLKRSITFILLFFAGLSMTMAQTCNIDNLLPKPEKIIMGNANSTFEFNSKTSIVHNWDNKDFTPALSELDRIAVEVFGKKMKKNTKAHGDNNVIFKYDGSLTDEEYVLEFTPENILISAKSGAGAFYAVQTLKQIIPVQAYETPINIKKLTFPTMKICDKPHFAYRGFMLDCSRHFWNVETIKKTLDILAMHKMNRFHWHLTEDQGWRIEIKKYPLLTKIGSKREQTTTGRNEGMDGIPYGG